MQQSIMFNKCKISNVFDSKTVCHQSRQLYRKHQHFKLEFIVVDQLLLVFLSENGSLLRSNSFALKYYAIFLCVSRNLDAGRGRKYMVKVCDLFFFCGTYQADIHNMFHRINNAFLE